jgi:hypothetical protein
MGIIGLFRYSKGTGDINKESIGVFGYIKSDIIVIDNIYRTNVNIIADFGSN